MQILNSWKESLQLLLPPRVQKIALVTVKATVDAWKHFLRSFWWLLAVAQVSLIWPSLMAVRISALALSYLVLLLLLRPSVGRKDPRTIVQMLCVHWQTIFVAVAVLSIEAFAPGSALIDSLIFTLPVFLVLFMFDAPPTWRGVVAAFFRALQFDLHNLPLASVLLACVYLLELVRWKLIMPPALAAMQYGWPFAVVSGMLHWLLSAVPLCALLSTIYIVRIHANPTQYTSSGCD